METTLGHDIIYLTDYNLQIPKSPSFVGQRYPNSIKDNIGVKINLKRKEKNPIQRPQVKTLSQKWLLSIRTIPRKENREPSQWQKDNEPSRRWEACQKVDQLSQSWSVLSFSSRLSYDGPFTTFFLFPLIFNLFLALLDVASDNPKTIKEKNFHPAKEKHQGKI